MQGALDGQHHLESKGQIIASWKVVVKMVEACDVCHQW
jgi:hypothetical protein